MSASPIDSTLEVSSLPAVYVEELASVALGWPSDEPEHCERRWQLAALKLVSPSWNGAKWALTVRGSVVLEAHTQRGQA